MDFKKVCDSVRREIFYNIPIEFGIPMKLVRLIKTLSIVHVDMFPIKNSFKKGDTPSQLLSIFALEHNRRRFQVEIKWYTSACGFC
jgi:hypothetical protein